MKKFLYAALAALVLCAVPHAASAQQVPGATSRVEVYAGQNPDTNESNIEPRFRRLELGTLMRDVLGALGTSGAWSNLAITPASGLYVTMNPATSSQLGAVYQFGSDDTTALPPSPGQSPNQLPADNTKIVIQATQNAPSGNIGPLSAPSGAGNAIYYMVEAQLSSVDTANQSMLFVSSSGVTSYQNVNTQRQDVIVYQTKAGSSSAADCSTTFPTPPNVDSGWIEIGTVCIAHGVTQVTSGMIAMFGGTNFNGASFGKIFFGGNYVSGGCVGATVNCSPTVLSSNQNTACGSANSGLGFTLNNPPGNPILRGDLNGDLFVCGPYLFIDDAVSNIPKLEVNTTVNAASPTVETLYPAIGASSVTTSSSCPTGTVCSNLSEKDICSNAGTATVASIVVEHAFTGEVIPMLSYPTSGTGVQVLFYNISGGGLGSTAIHFTYVCF